MLYNSIANLPLNLCLSEKRELFDSAFVDTGAWRAVGRGVHAHYKAFELSGLIMSLSHERIRDLYLNCAPALFR